MRTIFLFLAFFIISQFGFSQNYHVLDYHFNNTPAHGIKIATNIPFQNSSQMPTVSIVGYDYVGSRPIDIKIVWYIYNNVFYRAGAIANSSYKPEIKLANENGKVVIFLNIKRFFTRFTVDVYEKGLSAQSSWFDGWSAQDEAISGGNILTVTYDDIEFNEVKIKSSGGDNPFLITETNSGNSNQTVRFNHTSSWTSENDGSLLALYNGLNEQSIYLDARKNQHTYFNAGNVGIGTDNPTNPLTIQKISGGVGVGGSDGTGGVRVNWSTGFGVALDAWDGGHPRWGITKFSGNTPTVLIEGSYQTNNVIFNSGGNVGIGTSSPTGSFGEKLHIHSGSSNVGLKISRGDGAFGSFLAYQEAILLGSITNHDVRFMTNATTKLTINKNGNIGIGEASPASKLDVNGGISISGVNSLRSISDYYNALQLINPSCAGIVYNPGEDDELLFGFHSNKTFHWGAGPNAPNAGYWMYLTASALTVRSNLVIGSGSLPSGYKLAVSGDIICEGIKVKLQSDGWPDYVFADDYDLPTLNEVEHYIEENKHLPDVPSESEVIENGIELGEMNKILLQKIEELTLYTIELNKIVQKQNETIKNQNIEIETIKNTINQ